jgi:hypothetical protein
VVELATDSGTEVDAGTRSEQVEIDHDISKLIRQRLQRRRVNGMVVRELGLQSSLVLDDACSFTKLSGYGTKPVVERPVGNGVVVSLASRDVGLAKLAESELVHIYLGTQ